MPKTALDKAISGYYGEKKKKKKKDNKVSNTYEELQRQQNQQRQEQGKKVAQQKKETPKSSNRRQDTAQTNRVDNSWGAYVKRENAKREERARKVAEEKKSGSWIDKALETGRENNWAVPSRARTNTITYGGKRNIGGQIANQAQNNYDEASAAYGNIYRDWGNRTDYRRDLNRLKDASKTSERWVGANKAADTKTDIERVTGTGSYALGRMSADNQIDRAKKEVDKVTFEDYQSEVEKQLGYKVPGEYIPQLFENYTQWKDDAKAEIEKERGKVRESVEEGVKNTNRAQTKAISDAIGEGKKATLEEEINPDKNRVKKFNYSDFTNEERLAVETAMRSFPGNKEKQNEYLRMIGGDELVKKTGDVIAAGVAQHPFAAGVAEGFLPVSVYRNAGGEMSPLAQDVYQSGVDTLAYGAGYMGGMAGQFAATGATAMGEALASKVLPKIGSNAGKFWARRGAEVLTESPIDIADAYKNSIDENGNFNADEFKRQMLFNLGMNVAVGGAIDVGGNLLTQRQAQQFLDLDSKRLNGTLTEEETKKYLRLRETLNRKATERFNLGADKAREALEGTNTPIIEETSLQALPTNASEGAKAVARRTDALNRMTKATGVEYRAVTEDQFVDELRAVRQGMEDDLAALEQTRLSRGLTQEEAATYTDLQAKIAEMADENLEGFAYHGVYIPTGSGRILINADSPRSFQTILGHETTHLLEDTEDYGVLSEMLETFARNRVLEDGRTEYDEIADEIVRTYGAADQREITADLASRYLFGENADEFIRELSTNRNLFQKIYDYIRKAIRSATGDEEVRQLMEIEKKFKAAFDEAGYGADRAKFSKTLESLDTRVKSGNVTQRDVVGTNGRVTPEADELYMKYINDGDEESAQRLVELAAEANGYTIDAYHGSDAFGFTAHDLDMERDGASIFAAKDLNIAKTYISSGDVRDVSSRQVRKADVDELRDYIDDTYGNISEITDAIDEWESEVLDMPNREWNGRKTVQLTDDEMSLRGYIEDAVYRADQNDFIGEDFGEGVYGDEYYRFGDGAALSQDEIDDILDRASKFDDAVEGNGIYHAKLKMENPLVVNSEGMDWSNIKGTAFRGSPERHIELEDSLSSFKTEFDEYVDSLGGPAEVRRTWDELRKQFIEEGRSKTYKTFDEYERDVEEYMDLDELHTTRQVAKYAKDNGYDGVVFKGLYDIGHFGGIYDTAPTDIYIVFDPGQFKVVDTITRNDDGNIIPLSERFNSANEDMRFSKELADTHREELLRNSKELYGSEYTDDFNETGFIFPDGKMPKMGEAKYGARDDHNVVIGLYDDINYDTSQTPKADAMSRFLNEGNIRITPETGGIELSADVKPTKEQYSALRDFLEGKDEAQIEFTSLDSKAPVDFKEYENGVNDTQVINDIKRFYAEGKIGGSNLNNFRYSKEKKPFNKIANDGSLRMGYLELSENGMSSAGHGARNFEPEGEYMTIRGEGESVDSPDIYEHGTIDFENPLYIQHVDEAGGYGGWREELSKDYGGRTGSALSDRLRDEGYDAIITLDDYAEGFDPSNVVEVVNLAGRKVEPDAQAQKQLAPYEVFNHKREQFEVIKNSGEGSPFVDAGDIYTYDEVVKDYFAYFDNNYADDYTRKDMQAALRSGEITVYSAEPIGAGTLVSPSKMEAETIADGGKIYSKTVKVDDVAWDSAGAGQYAKVAEAKPEKATRTPAEASGVKFTKENNYITPESIVDDDGNMLKEAVDAYMEAANKNDVATAQRFWRAWKIAKGSTVDGFHGTKMGRLKEFDLSKTVNKRSIYMSTDFDTSNSYLGNPTDPDNLSSFNADPPKDVEDYDRLQNFLHKYPTIRSAVHDWFETNAKVAEDGETYTIKDGAETLMRSIRKEWKYDANKSGYFTSDGKRLTFGDMEAIERLVNKVDMNREGVYPVTINPGARPLVLDAHGQEWTDIYPEDLSEALGRDVTGDFGPGDFIDTDSVVTRYAVPEGYTSVEFRDIIDSGGSYDIDPATNHTVFAPWQIKADEPILRYADGDPIPPGRKVGDVIPINERLDYTGPNKNLLKFSKELKGFDERLKSGKLRTYDVMRRGKVTYEAEAAYAKAYSDNDREIAQNLVDAVLRAKGYKYEGYHGTARFGFTKFDLGRLDDKMSIFTSKNVETARTYAMLDDYARPRDIDSASGGMTWLNEIKKAAKLQGASAATIKRFDDLAPFIKEEAAKTRKSGSAVSIYKLLDDIVSEHEELTPIKRDIEDIASYIYENLQHESGGIYHTRLKIEKPLVLNCHRNSWNMIHNTHFVDDEVKKAFSANKNYTTRDVAAYAKENGYDGVIFKDLWDKGPGGVRDVDPTTVYIAFDPSQVKSADPFTYDDGVLVPLSMRGNVSEADMRFSKEKKPISRQPATYAEALNQFTSNPRKFTPEETKAIKEDGYKLQAYIRQGREDAARAQALQMASQYNQMQKSWVETDKLDDAWYVYKGLKERVRGKRWLIPEGSARTVREFNEHVLGNPNGVYGFNVVINPRGNYSSIDGEWDDLVRAFPDLLDASLTDPVDMFKQLVSVYKTTKAELTDSFTQYASREEIEDADREIADTLYNIAKTSVDKTAKQRNLINGQVQASLKEGMSEDDIKYMLKEAGVSDVDIDNALNVAKDSDDLDVPNPYEVFTEADNIKSQSLETPAKDGVSEPAQGMNETVRKLIKTMVDSNGDSKYVQELVDLFKEQRIGAYEKDSFDMAAAVAKHSRRAADDYAEMLDEVLNGPIPEDQRDWLAKGAALINRCFGMVCDDSLPERIRDKAAYDLALLIKRQDTSHLASVNLSARNDFLKVTPNGRVSMGQRVLDNLSREFKDRLNGERLELTQEEIKRLERADTVKPDLKDKERLVGMLNMSDEELAKMRADNKAWFSGEATQQEMEQARIDIKRRLQHNVLKMTDEEIQWFEAAKNGEQLSLTPEQENHLFKDVLKMTDEELAQFKAENEAWFSGKAEQLNFDVEDRVYREVLRLTDEEIAWLEAGYNGEQLQMVLDDIFNDRINKLPISWFEKFNEWRHYAMLFNVRTHGRNLAANGVFALLRVLSDGMEIGLQYAAHKAGLIETRSMVKAKKLTAAEKDHIKKEFEEAYAASGSHIKFIDTAHKDMFEGTKIKIKPVSKAVDLNYKLLEWEDMLTFKRVFETNYNRYCTSRGLDILNMDVKDIAEARKFAIEQAEYATFRDTSKLSHTITRAKEVTAVKKGRTRMGTVGYRTANAILEGILPFVKTPINVFRRSVDYSPLAFGKALNKFATAARTGDEEFIKQGIHDFSTALTGTGVLAFGAWLYAQGIITIQAGDESGDAYYDRDMGYQDYSLRLKVGGKWQSWTIDWASPTQSSIFMGARLWQSFTEDDMELSPQDFFNALVMTVDPLIDTSFLASTKDMVQQFQEQVERGNAKEGQNDWGGAISQLVMGKLPQNYFGGFIPQVVAQAATFTDEYQRDTRSTNADPVKKSWEQFMRQQQNKIPWVRENGIPVLGIKGLNPKLDRRGRNVKVVGETVGTKILYAAINPSTVKNITEDKYDREVIAIHNDTAKDYIKNSIYYHFTGNPPYELLEGGRMSYDELYDYTKTSRVDQTKTLKNMVDSDAYENMPVDFKGEILDDGYNISLIRADRTVYGDDYAYSLLSKKKVKGRKTIDVAVDKETLKYVDNNDYDKSKFLDYYEQKERLISFTQDTSSTTSHHTRALAAAITGNRELLKPQDVKDEYYDVEEEYINKFKGTRSERVEKAIKEYTTADCNISSFLSTADKSGGSMKNRAVAAANFEIKRRTYKAMGFEDDDANMGIGLKKYGYDFASLDAMKEDMEEKGVSGWEDVRDYINTLGIEDDAEKASLFRYWSRAKNPWNLPNYLAGSENKSNGGGSGGGGRRRGRRSGRRSGGSSGSSFMSWQEYLDNAKKTSGAASKASSNAASTKVTSHKYSEKDVITDAYKKRMRKMRKDLTG